MDTTEYKRNWLAKILLVLVFILFITALSLNIAQLDKRTAMVMPNLEVITASEAVASSTGN